MEEYRQLIIVRKDLDMSAGKLAAQVAHASNAFLTAWIRNIIDGSGSKDFITDRIITKGIYENWIKGSFTKTVCQAKNKNKLNKAINIANEMGLVENIDYWIIKDNCLTELEPEEIDENGVGRTVTCIGFKPMPTKEAHKISKKFNLYR